MGCIRTFLITLCALVAAMPAMGQTPVFFETLYDVPVMPGLTEMPDMALVFDTPEGRIAQAGAAGNGSSFAPVAAFYAAALPSLGWQPLGTGVFVRDGERLELVSVPGSVPLTVRFTLSPAP